MTTEPRSGPPLTPPKSHASGSWEVKISRAKEARGAAKVMRKDKPATFATRRIGRS